MRAMEPHQPTELAIDIDEHQHVAISDPIMLLDDIEEASQESSVRVDVVREGTAHCVCGWFVERWSGGDISYGPGTRHGAQRAFMLPSAAYMDRGGVCEIQTNMTADGEVSVSMRMASGSGSC